MKKIFTILLVTILLFLMAFPAQAASPASSISPRYNYIDTYDIDLLINKTTGVASCSASCYTASNNKVAVEYKLQRYMGSYWGTVKTWTSSGTSYAGINQSWAVSSGYTYRGQATYKVYDSSGNLLESTTVTKTYSYPAT